MKPNDSKKPSARIWGLTGGIASGKSTVARLFAEAGIAVLDADQIARELRAPGGAAHDTILQRFGTADPARLRDLVFADATARGDLEAILHPLIREESAKRIEAAVQASQASVVPVIYEASLLVETGRYKDFAGLIVVSADENLRLQRLIARDRSPEELARKIMKSQILDDERRRHATFVIENHGTGPAAIEDLRQQILKIIPELTR